jgi:hypothetical protein
VPVDAIIPEAVKLVPVAAPILGVVNEGVVARTGAPVPVAVVHTGKDEAPPPTKISVVAALASVWFAAVGEVPVAIRAYAVVPVARPVPPLAIGRIPVTAVVSGIPVTLVITPDAGVPSAGFVSVGLVNNKVLVSCFVTPPCTIGKTSVVAAAVAVGRPVMATLDMIRSSLRKR